ncbi:MAG: hypothetical protein HZB38_04920, partial [Planctomycetes bacterium]|nr:hypothetical protein [Planctomycetota bacterium]
VSVAVSFGFYEATNDWATKAFELSPAYAEPCCLMGLFLVSLIVLRSAADNLIRGNVHVPQWMDWGGASVCGFVNAQLTVGTLVIGVAMLPIGGRPLGFDRYDRTEDSDQAGVTVFERKALWTRSDEMTVGLFNLLSGGSMRGSTAFNTVYPNFTDAVYFSTNTVQPESTPSPYRDKKGGDGFKEGISLEQWWEQKKPLADARYRKAVPTDRERTPPMELLKSVTAEPGNKLLAMRVQLKRAAADREGNAAHLFRPTMIRLVGDTNGRPEQYTPKVLGGADAFIGGANRVVDFDNNLRIDESDPLIDAFFDVPADFQPRFVEYRRHARAAVSEAEFKKEPPKVSLRLKTGEERQQEAQAAAGRQTFGQVSEGSTIDTLPFEFASAKLKNSSDVKLKGEQIVHARLSGNRSQYELQSGQPGAVKTFQVPQGYRILQIRYKPKEARTIVGQVFNYVGGTVNQYIAVDDRGDKHLLAGYYAIVKRGNEDRFELFFNGPDDDQLDPSFKHMLDFKNVEKNELNDSDNATICLIFLVKPGTRITRIENQVGDGGEVGITIPP